MYYLITVLEFHFCTKQWPDTEDRTNSLRGLCYCIIKTLQCENKLFMSYVPVQLTACLPPAELKHVFKICQGLMVDTISAIRPAVSHSNLCSLSMQFPFIGHCE